jgi:hypothetical protein
MINDCKIHVPPPLLYLLAWRRGSFNVLLEQDLGGAVTLENRAKFAFLLSRDGIP